MTTADASDARKGSLALNVARYEASGATEITLMPQTGLLAGLAVQDLAGVDGGLLISQRAVEGCGPPGRQRDQRAVAGGARGDNGLVIDIDPGTFEDMVITALDGLPEELGRLMRNVAVTVEHGPGPPGLLGLYQGIPLTSRTADYAGVLPDRITIYRREICAICQTEQEVAGQVRRTVIHEIAHHFGIDDHRLSELGW